MVAKGAKRKATGENEVAIERCNDLARAIKDAANLSDDVTSMLVDMLPHSLGQPKDKRQRFQEQAIESVDRVMQVIEDNLKKNTENARDELLKAQRAAAPSEAAVTEAEVKLHEDTDRFNNETKILAKSALAFRAARSAVDDAKKTQTTGDQDFETALKKKSDLQAMLDDLVEPLKNGTVAELDVDKQSKTLLSSLRQFNEIDDAMMMVLGSSLAKAPSARGNFDIMAIEQLDKCMAKRMEPLDETLQAGEAGKQERANAVKYTEECLQEALQAQKQRAEVFEAAWNTKTKDEQTLQAARHAVKDLAAQTKACDKKLYKVEADFEVFEDYARKSFEELKERPSPPEPVVPEQCPVPADVEGAMVDTEIVLPEVVLAA